MEKRNLKDDKLNLIFYGFIWLMMFLVDCGVFLFVKSSDIGFFVELGLKKGIVLLLTNIILVISVFFRKKLRKFLYKNHFIKVINFFMLLLTPLFLLVGVQLIIGAGSYVLLTSYFIKNLILYYAIYIVFLLVFQKVSVSISLYTLIMTVLALVDYFVTAFRGKAFLIMDIFNVGTAAEVAGNYSLKLPVQTGICLQAILIYILYQILFQSLEIGKRNIKGYVIRFGVLGVVIVSVCSNWKLLAGERVDQWDTAGEYENKGYLYKLACETQYLAIDKPVDYSVERVNEIALVTEKNDIQEKESETIIPENIIVIMNESLADFEEFDNFKASEEILPGIHNLQKNTKKGYVYVPSFGGGTSDTEYEVLTGNTKQFLPSGGIAYQLYCKEKELGLANLMEDMGYYTTAIHPSWATAWNRSKVYSWMDFENFISMDNWGDTPEYYRWYVSDACAYEKLEEMYENEEIEKQFMFCVTIQNHGGYDVSKKYKANVKLSLEQDYPEAEVYLSLARKSDESFMDLLDYFEEVEEPTMIVMFGDHWPSLEQGFYSELFGQDFGTLDLAQVQETYKTPYVIWTNYPSESIEEDMSANYFGSYILEQAGLEMTTYNKFLLQLKEKLPIIGISAVCDEDGNWYAMDSLPDEYKELINEYKILQYNNVADRKHRVEDVFELAG